MKSQLIANGKYKLLKKLGNGAFGEIYEGQIVETRQFVAVKLEDKKYQHPQLEYEYNLYKLLQG